MLAIVLGGFVGLALGLVGAGGSILTVPALVYGLGLPVSRAIPASLVLVGLIAAIGAVAHFRKGSVRLDVALRFGGAGILGAIIGARLSPLVEPRTLLLLFSGLMLMAAISLARRDLGNQAPASAAPAIPEWGHVYAVGLGVGTITGFFGVGGGFIIVPALGLFVGLPTRQAVGTSLVVIVINCVAGLFSHLTREAMSLPIGTLALFALGGFASSTGGARLAGRWPDRRLSQVFAVIVAAVAVYLLMRNV